MLMLEQRIQQQFFESADLQYQTAESLSRPLVQAAAALLGSITGGGKVLVHGCGQAAALAAHVEGLLIGHFERERPPLAALAVMAPRAAAQLQALGHPGDTLLLLEAGDAAAALDAVAAAHEKEMTVVALTGLADPALREGLGEADVLIAVPHERTIRVLETQLLALHCLCDAIDLQLMGEQGP